MSNEYFPKYLSLCKTVIQTLECEIIYYWSLCGSDSESYASVQLMNYYGDKATNFTNKKKKPNKWKLDKILDCQLFKMFNLN